MGNKISDTAKIATNVIVGNNVIVGDNVIVKEGCIIGDNVFIGDNVLIDNYTIVRNDVTIKAGCMIGAQCILGEYLVDFYEKKEKKVHPLVIGENAIIRSGCIIYGDNEIGKNFQTGHRVTIRENSKIGNNVRIGTLSDIQGYCQIEDYVNMHSNVHIGQKSTVKKYAWIFPYVVLTNDPNPPSETMLGVIIEEYAVVSTGSVVLPGVIVGKDALVGAGAVVTKNIDEGMVAFGNPAKMHGEVKQIKNNITGEAVYPWRYTFDRGMPWNGQGYENWSKGQCEE